VFTTATFVGYMLGGLTGAAIATAAIFLPAFVFVWISAPLIPLLRRSPLAAAMLDGVNAASLALMAAVTVTLAREALVSVLALGVAVASLVLLLRFRASPTFLIAVTGLIAWLGGRP
jgi:chromate transporter